mgnify:CR=1 FL=1
MTDNADVITYLTSAFYSRFTALTGGVTNGFYDAINGQLFEDEAPPGTLCPYAVYSVIAAPKEKTFSEEYTNTLIQLSIFSAASSSAEIKNAYYQAHVLYDEKPLNITGSTLVSLKETNLVTMKEKVTNPDGTNWSRQYILDLEAVTSLD